ncbi:Retrovirus-related Pol polyprotein from transposon RE1 [Vitis vinifera]|uniref:Retrovirus-related Pol polyprotein from transposon RE1 n=1 Tax=Vitis vinifera TaxID=29760 RepID=A0A438C4S5_VITVI|nr:Retrovirus-related Pol polyprotein from transposon RE1 [Vitis vinifera]
MKQTNSLGIGINFVDHFLNQGAPAEHKSAETPIGHESILLLAYGVNLIRLRKSGHSRETCWKIHGKPVDWKPRQPLEKEGRGNHVATMNNRHNLKLALLIRRKWRCFRNYCLLFCQYNHKLAHLPTRSLVPEPWLTKDLDSGKTIGNAEECFGLYILKERHDPQEQPQMAVESFNQPESIVDLWDKEHIQEETEEGTLSQQTHEQNRVLIQANFQHHRDTSSSEYQEAFKYPKWKAAVDEEVRALEKNGTWEITDLPRGKKPVGCKWIFTVKYKADGNVDRYKARLVAKGFTQSYGIDYQETFAPIAKLNTVRVLLSLAANLDWSLHQLDVKNAFLNGDLEEEVYMDIHAGLETTSNFNKVCRLRKSLYGLKQSPRAWFERFTKVVKGYGFVQCQSDHTLFVKHFPEGKLAIIIVYVDDIILTGDHEEKIDLLKKLLTKEFEIKDLGNLKYFLGMEIARSKKGIVVSQRKYVLDLLNETGMLGCKPTETPMDTTVKLEESDGSAPVDKGRYQRLVGKLIYLSHTRPDIGFSVSVVSQFMNNPTEKHMTAVIRILRYLKMTSGKGLFFQRTTKKEIEIFSDADWAGSVTDRRSTLGYCSFVWGNLVTWRSKKQSVVARSSAEAEFHAMAQGICEGIWLNRLLKELRVPLKHPMVLYCDNQAAISIAKNPVHHDRTKHVEIDRHFIKEKIEEGVFKVSYTPTNYQTADILTKALARVNFEDLTKKLGMINIYSAA